MSSDSKNPCPYIAEQISHANTRCRLRQLLRLSMEILVISRNYIFPCNQTNQMSTMPFSRLLLSSTGNPLWEVDFNISPAFLTKVDSLTVITFLNIASETLIFSIRSFSFNLRISIPLFLSFRV